MKAPKIEHKDCSACGGTGWMYGLVLSIECGYCDVRGYILERVKR